MRRIYAQATKVLIWLGEETEDVLPAFKYIPDTSWAHKNELYGFYQQINDDYHTGEPRFDLEQEGWTGEYYH
jgi:hypothetical protein